MGLPPRGVWQGQPQVVRPSQLPCIASSCQPECHTLSHSFRSQTGLQAPHGWRSLLAPPSMPFLGHLHCPDRVELFMQAVIASELGMTCSVISHGSTRTHMVACVHPHLNMLTASVQVQPGVRQPLGHHSQVHPRRLPAVLPRLRQRHGLQEGALPPICRPG